MKMNDSNINNLKKLDKKLILITGGTGSFGKAFIQQLLYSNPKIKKIVVYSRDELKQWNFQQQFPKSKYSQLRFFLGDVRDSKRLKRALDEFVIDGIKTTIPFFQEIITQKDFLNGSYDINWLEKYKEAN